MSEIFTDDIKSLNLMQPNQYAMNMVWLLLLATAHHCNNHFTGEIIMLSRIKLVAAFTAGLIVSTSAFAGAVVLPENVTVMPEPVTGTCCINIGFSVNYDNNYSSYLEINRTGSAGLANPGSYSSSPVGFIPFIYTYAASGSVSYGRMIYDGHSAFAVNWIDIYAYGSALHNSYQLILVDRSDVRAGDFDFIFNYDTIQWDGSNDYYFTPTLTMGYSTISYTDHSISFYGYSSHSDGLLVLNSSQLPYNSINSDVLGRYVFEVRNGEVLNPLPLFKTVAIPEPETWAMLLAGLGIVGAVTRRQRTRAAM
jgi:hypothetical protein